MRLIDADAIPWTDLNDNPNSKIRVLITFADKVNKMPTIEERKTGEWIPIIKGNEFGEAYQAGIYCSECGETLSWEANYCPNCGADMRGEQDG